MYIYMYKMYVVVVVQLIICFRAVYQLITHTHARFVGKVLITCDFVHVERFC